MAMAVQRLVNFWNKYENANLKIAFGLMSLQIIHLYWLTTSIVLPKIGTEVFLRLPESLLVLYILVDYIEIPALVSGVAYYSLNIYQKRKPKDVLFLVMLVIQVFHIFWLTDEIVYQTFFEEEGVEIPIYAAWIAILIDYLEIPVMADLLRRVIKGKRDTR